MDEQSDRSVEAGWSVGRGWLPIVRDLDRQLRENVPGFQGFAEVKPKFSELRAYPKFEDATPGEARRKAYLLVEAAAERCAAVCERCGHQGRLREDRSWVLTLCDGCDQAVPGAGGDGLEIPDAALWRRVRLARALREAHEASRAIVGRGPDYLAACGLAAWDLETLERWWRAAVAGIDGPSSDEAPDPADQEARQLLRQLSGGAHMASFAAKKLRARYPDLFDQTGATVEDIQRLSMLWHGAMGTREALTAGDGGQDSA